MDNREREMALIGGFNPTGSPVIGFTPLNVGNMKPQMDRLQKPGGNPIFPGVQFGATIQQIREFIKNQKRCRGFTFELAIGAANELQINLSGTAKMLLGFAILTDPDFPRTVKMRLNINNEIVIEETTIDFFSNEFTDDEYYWFPRPLSGTDSITMNANADIAQNIFIAVYYI